MFYRLARPILFTLDPERAHGLTIAGLKALPKRRSEHQPVLASTVAGIAFPSPVGLAAGFDKNAEVPGALLSLGFGFVEVGTLTPRPQQGNPRPRLFRLVEDEGVINRMGFNNDGQPAARKRLAGRANEGVIGVVGVNVGANKDAADRVADYVEGVRAMSNVADYLTINISSPNTPGLRGLQDAGALTELLAAVQGLQDKPIFLKLAPDLDTPEIDGIVKAAHGQVAALIVGNTTVSRPGLRSRFGSEAGGLSGVPLKSLAAQKLRAFRSASGAGIPLVAAGGINSADEAYARIRAGASLVQLYSALVYHGPGLARRVSQELADLLRRDGFATVSDAIGIDA